MKIFLCLVFCLASLPFARIFAQDSVASPKSHAPEAVATLTKFNLDFPGGTPRELATAIQKAMGRPLNVVIPSDFANMDLIPPFVVTGVTADRLFLALEKIGVKHDKARDGWPNYAVGFALNYAFKAQQPITDESVWYFAVYENSNQLAIQSRFYLLTPYLEQGLTVDDITTAVQVAWKMMGDSDAPQLSYHKETKLLIAVGPPDRLQAIDQVLSVLNPPKPKTAEGANGSSSPAPAPKSGP